MNELDSALESQESALFIGILNWPIWLFFADFGLFLAQNSSQTDINVRLGGEGIETPTFMS